MKIFGYDIQRSRVEKAADKPKETAVGVVGLRSSSGIIEEEFIRDLRWPDAGKIYQEMADNDAIVGAALYLIETIIRKAKWTVAPATDEPTDIEHAQFVESCMHDMQQQTWDDFICEALSMLTYGFSFHEVLYKVRRGPNEKDAKFQSKFSDGKVGWQELPTRSQATLSEWVFDDQTGKPIEFVQDPGQVGADGDKVNIPLEGNLLFKTKSKRGNPEGQSILRRAYRSWYFKRYIEELEGIGIERNLAGIPHLQPAEGVDLFNPDNENMVEMLAWAQTLVNDIRQDRNHGIITPHGWKLELIGGKGSAGVLNTDKVIHRYDTRIAMAMLADVIVMGGDRTGSFALAEVKHNLFITSLQAIINNICEVFNTHAIPKLFAYNGIELEAYPKMQASDLETPSLKEIALLLRAMKIDVYSNRPLYNFLVRLINAPEVNEEDYETMRELVLEAEGRSDGDSTLMQDDIDNDLKQSDLDYV